MKTLLIVKHGKSSWTKAGWNDIDRPLKTRGLNNAYSMAHRLVKRKIEVDRLITSPATRAFHTAMIFARTMSIPLTKVAVDDVIYDGNVDSLIRLIQCCDEEVNTLMIVGHNPLFTDLANVLTGKSIENIPTSGVAAVVFREEEWNGVEEGRGKLDFFDFPRHETEV